MKRASMIVVLLVVAGGVVGAAPVAAQGTDASGTSTVDCSFPVTATDATGTAVTVNETPERVVVLGPSAAQTTWEIGARDRVVGMPVNQYTAYLNGSEERADVVDDQGQPIAERVVDQEPDLVLAPNIVGNQTVENLRDRGLTVYRYEAATSLEDVYAKTRLTGRLVGHYRESARVSARMEGRVQAIRDAVRDEERPRVYYAMPGGWTAGPGSFVHEIVRAAGGQNVAADHLDGSYGTLSPEVLASEDPEYLILEDDNPVPSSAALNDSTAVREDRIVRVSSNYLTQPGPRNVVAIETLLAAFHPTASENLPADVTTPSVPRCTGTAGEESTDGGAAGPTSSLGPGFGVPAVVATLAVLLTAFVFRRRD